MQPTTRLARSGSLGCAVAQEKLGQLGVDVSAQPQARAGQQVLPMGTTALEVRIRRCSWSWPLPVPNPDTEHPD